MSEIIPVEIIENKIYIIRNHKVMLDSDLANLYDVETKRINESVKRNIERFPQNFMFQLNDTEWQNLRSQFATSNKNYGGRRYNPYVFTEHGVLMLSNVLNSKRAIAVSIQIIEVFTKMREMILANNDLAKRLDEMERHFINYARDNDVNIEDIYKQLDYLKDITKPEKIGFKWK